MQKLPIKQAFLLELGFAAGGGEGKRMMRDKQNASQRLPNQTQGGLCPPARPGLPQQRSLVCDAGSGACTTPQRHAVLRSKHPAPPRSSPTVLWGKFLQDASCYSLNPLSSFSSIKLGIAKASSDLAIRSCFCRAAPYSQQAFPSLVNTWIFWLGVLSTAVSGNGSCPACASPQKR